MTKTKTKVLAITAAAVLTAGIASAALAGVGELRTVEALSADSTVTYPFATGTDSFKNATIVNSAKGTDFNTLEITFDKVTSFANVEYVAVQLNISKLGANSSVSFAAGFYSQAMGGVIYWDTVDMNYGGTSNVLFQEENGDITAAPLKANKTDGDWYYRDGDNLVFSKATKGTLWIPTSALNKRGWDSADVSSLDKTKIKSLYIIYHAGSSYDWELQFGSIGVYGGEPGTAEMTYAANCTTGERRNNYWIGGAPNATISFNSDKAMPRIAYEFANGEDAYKNTVNWKPTAANETLTVNFDEAAVNLSDATHLLVQYYSAEAPRLQFTLSDGTKNSSLKSGARVFFMPMDANFTDWYVTANGSGVSFGINKGRYMMGMVVIPIEESFSTGASLSAIKSLVIKTAGATDVVIGGVASYKAERGDGAYADGTHTTLLSLSESKAAKYVPSKANTVEEIQAKPAAGKMYGTSATVTQDLTFTGKQYNDSWDGTNADNATGLGTIFEGGSYGTLTMVKDTYGDDAIQFTSTGFANDTYTALNNLGNGFMWEGKKGIVLWARNDSQIEVSFNIEIECTAVVEGTTENKTANTRYNIRQGNRFYLYDVNTGKTSIYMTRPTATLPVGFEGWVWIPFTAFNNAWGGGVPESRFMGENSYVSFIAFSIDSGKVLNAPISINSIGAYSQTPTFDSVYVNANGNTIPELMGLTAQEEN